jgi:hypothetical protein
VAANAASDQHVQKTSQASKITKHSHYICAVIGKVLESLITGEYRVQTIWSRIIVDIYKPVKSEGIRIAPCTTVKLFFKTF